MEFNISLRKINSLILLIVFILLILHLVLAVSYMYGLIPYSPDFKIWGRRLFILLSLHVLISSYLFIKSYIKTHKYNKYTSLNKDSLGQMITGICIVLFVILHVLNYTNHSISSNIFYPNILIVDNLLFISIILHLRISIPRLCVSFGFLEGGDSFLKFQKRVNILLLIIIFLVFFSEILFYGGLL